MNEFRQALDAHADGQLDLAAVERELNLGLTHRPHLAAAHGALVEALYRSGRIGGESYLALIQVVRAFQQLPPRVSVQVAPNPAPAPAPTSANDADRTRLRAPAPAPQPPPAAAPGEPEKTQFRAPRPASAAAQPVAATPRPDPTGSTTGSSTGTRTPTGSRPTSSDWGELPRHVAEAATLDIGSVVKERFVLEEELGRGGMGIVFKARDLRKEEAQDRNPWVALKLLNEEFRRHPESLRALQRESRKAQHLAHANVVTVYDFDRDGGNVFMVMELLEGQSLDRLIRDHEGSGVGVERALRLTRDMCRAMAYAHEQGVVHSDFKPANAFLTHDNVVKVFDFGIARAAKRADNVSGSVTLFDPGTLGALTPTYASCEMIEGLEPDSRDDVYAIACVCYELLTGKHPFDRQSAVEARNKRLAPKRPRGLKRHQWRAIQHGLQFNREDRTTSAQQFLNELMPRRRRPTVHIGVAAAVIVSIATVAVFVPGYLTKRRERNLIGLLTAADTQKLDALVRQLRELGPQDRAAILLDEGARSGLIKAFEARINAATDSTQPDVDYPLARTLLRELQAFLPDSLAVQDLEVRLVARENDEIKRLSDLFDDYLRQGLMIDLQGPKNIGAVLAAIRRIDGENALLRDPRLPGAFAAGTRKALIDGDPTLAQALVTAGLAIDSNDPTLADLRDQTLRAVNAEQLASRRQALETSLAAVTSPQAVFGDLAAHRAELDELRAVAPDSAVLASAQRLAQSGISEQSAQLVANGEHTKALELLSQYAEFLPSSFIEQQRKQLTSAQGAFESAQATVAQIKGQVDTLLQSQTADASWNAQFSRELRKLAAYVPDTDPYVVQARTRAAEGFLARARTQRASQHLSEAGTSLELARIYAPQSAALGEEAKLLDTARATQETAAQQRNRLAQLDALKAKLLVQARADDVNDALASLKELRANLDPDDGYLVVQAPDAIGSAYLRLASNAAKDGRFDNAVTLLARATEIAPGMDKLTPARDRYARYQAIAQNLQSGSVDGASLKNELDRLTRQDAAEGAAVKDRLARTLVARIRATTDANAARRLTAVAQEVFGDQAAVKEMSRPAPAQERAAAPTPSAATPAAAGTASATETRDVTAAPDAGAATAQAAASRPAAARGGNTRVAAVRPDAVADQAGAGPRLDPEIACAARLAGYGRRKQAVCYDTFDGGGRGPDLVVIPAGGTIAAPFAIGRTEISNADYATYCTRTTRCQWPAENPENPVTGISLEDARKYVAWLSQVTGVKYRLPTNAEWTHAVRADGAAADTGSINCSVEIGGKKVRGVALEAAQSGKANGWGLFNYLGNAQEWVVSGDAVLARGGAYTDNVSACTPDASRPQAGAADAITGLRVVRELQ
jgi:predicted Ser/Thr protein kinase